MQIQRKLQIQIENQGKRLQMMFEQQIKSDEPSASLSNAVLPPPNNNLEASREGHEKVGINNSTPENMSEESSLDASTKQKGDDAKVTGEHDFRDDQHAAPPAKRGKTEELVKAK